MAVADLERFLGGETEPPQRTRKVKLSKLEQLAAPGITEVEVPESSGGVAALEAFLAEPAPSERADTLGVGTGFEELEPSPEDFRPTITVARRVHRRLQESGEAVLEIPSIVGRLGTGKAKLGDLFTSLRAAAAPVELPFAVVGESLRTSAEEFGASPEAAQLIGAGGEIATGLALPFVKTATPGLGRPLQRIGVGRSPEATLEAERALEAAAAASRAEARARPVPAPPVEPAAKPPRVPKAKTPTAKPPVEALPPGVTEGDVFDRIQAINRTVGDILAGKEESRTVIFDPEALAQGRRRPIAAVSGGGRTLDLASDVFDELSALADVPPGKLLEAIKKDKGNPTFLRLRRAVEEQLGLEAAGELPPIVKTLGIEPGTPPEAFRAIEADFPELAGTPEAPPRPPVAPAAAPAAQAPLPSRAININLARLETADDVKRLIAEVGEANRPAIQEARRGTITHLETERLADTLGLTTEKLLERRRGAAFNAEEALASRRLLVESAENVWTLARVAREVGSDEALARVAEAMGRHVGIQKQVSGATAEAGRALSSFRIIAGPEGTRQRALKAVIDAVGGREKLTDNIIARLAAMDSQGPTFIRDMNIFLRDVTEAKTSDKIFEAWVNALLSGPQTHVINSTSNALVALTRSIEKGAAGTIDLLRAKVTGTPQERFIGEAGADLYGIVRGFREGLRKGLEAFQTELPSQAVSKIEAPRQAIPGRLGRVVRIPGRALIAEDEVFKAVASQAELHTRAYRQAATEGLSGEARGKRIAEILANPTEELLEAGREEALYRTFQGELGSIGKTLQRLRREIPGARVVAPFLRTPVNIAKFGLERTPLNFIRLAVKTKRGELPGGAASDELAKATLGSLIGLTVAGLTLEGRISGGGPTDPARRRALRATGWQPYSVKVGDQWIAYGRLEPLGMIVGLSADYVELFDKGLEEEDAVSKIGFAISQNLTSKTFLRGISDLVNAASDPERYGDRWVRSLGGTVIPTGAAQLARAIDPTFRRAESITEALRARTPGLSFGVKPLRDIWGQPVAAPETGPERLLSPVRRSPVIDDKASQEIVRLDVRPGTPRRQLGNLELTSEEYERYQVEAGRLARRLVVAFVESPGYDNLSDLQQVRGIEARFTKARDVARERLKPEAMRRLREEEGAEALRKLRVPKRQRRFLEGTVEERIEAAQGRSNGQGGRPAFVSP